MVEAVDYAHRVVGLGEYVVHQVETDNAAVVNHVQPELVMTGE